MDRTVALKKLERILGKKLAYRVDPKAPSQEEREQAREDLRPAIDERNALKARKEARMQALLDADPEYQELKAASKAAGEKVDVLASIARHFKMTVGTHEGMFFAVKAEGDSWEEILRKLGAKT